MADIQSPRARAGRLARYAHTVFLIVTVAAGPLVHAETFIRPPLDIDLVGEIRTVRAQHEDTLLDIARRHDVGQDEILLANRTVDRWLPGEGAEVTIPGRFVLPQAERSGLVLNVAEMRLYYFPVARPDDLETYPVSVGRMDWGTPMGTTQVIAKTANPSWRPPESIRLEAEARGEPLPEVIPPGPNNPLGSYALRLGVPGYLIHSTNKPFGVGMRVTHGCIRMYPEDIEILFPQVPVGTRVQIVNQPVKLGWFLDTLFMEVHPPLAEDAESTDLSRLAMDLINTAWQKRPLVLDGSEFKRAIKEKQGIPVAIGRAAGK